MFPRVMGEILTRTYVSLSASVDPLAVSVALDAVVVGIPKPGGLGNRPIVMANVMTRCIMALVARRARQGLRARLEGRGQYALTGVLPPIARTLEAVGRCVSEGVPWCVTAVDETNAFNSVDQRALVEAVRRLAQVNPTMASVSLRAHCSARGDTEWVLRGPYGAGEERQVVAHPPRGGFQGAPDMPALFAEVMAEVNEVASAEVVWGGGGVAGSVGPLPEGEPVPPARSLGGLAEGVGSAARVAAAAPGRSGARDHFHLRR